MGVQNARKLLAIISYSNNETCESPYVHIIIRDHLFAAHTSLQTFVCWYLLSNFKFLQHMLGMSMKSKGVVLVKSVELDWTGVTTS